MDPEQEIRSWMLDPEHESESLHGNWGPRNMVWVPICLAPLPQLVSIHLVGEGGEDLHDNWGLASTELARDDLQRTETRKRLPREGSAALGVEP